LDIVVKILWFVGGLALLFFVLDSAVRTFLLPRGETAFATRVVFSALRRVFTRLARLTRSYEARDRVMALYAPICLFLLPLAWLILLLFAFAAMYHALGVRGFETDFEMSGSSMFTLGFIHPPDLPTTTLSFFEAATGLTLLALLIAYLPTIYGAFSRREVLVSQLAVRAGEPPSGVELLARAQRMERFQLLDEMWVSWQAWFAEVEETHTSLAVLSFFRSPRSDRSWVTAAGAVLDAASLRLSAIDLPFDPQAGFCLRGGTFALRAVARYFDLPFDPDPGPTESTSITEDEFFDACDSLAAAGIPVRDDRDEAWQRFNGWRINYDQVLIGLAGLVMAPYAPWSSDRSLRYRRPVERHHLGERRHRSPE
jgi:hypothetical protein